MRRACWWPRRNSKSFSLTKPLDLYDIIRGLLSDQEAELFLRVVSEPGAIATDQESLGQADECAEFVDLM